MLQSLPLPNLFQLFMNCKLLHIIPRPEKHTAILGNYGIAAINTPPHWWLTHDADVVCARQRRIGLIALHRERH